MATASTLPTAPQNSSRRGVLRARRKLSTPTLFPDVPAPWDSGSSALQPPGPRPERVGIARLASSSPLADAKRGTEYFLLPVRSILNHCDSERVPFSWTVNPYRGCEFGCHYCYARYTHEYMELDSADFERKIYVKQDCGPLAGRDLATQKVHGEHIAIGTATDPYQPAEREYGATRAILEQMTTRNGLSISITTKSNQIVRDIDLLKRIDEKSSLSLNITVTTLRARLARLLEPRAPRPDLRLEAMRQLNAAGVNAGVICAPVLPGITDSPRDLETVVRSVAEAGGKYVFANPLFLKPCSAAVFLPFLEKEFPHLAASYRQKFASRAFLPDGYRKRISELMKKLRAKYGIVNAYERYSRKSHPTEGEQLGLF